MFRSLLALVFVFISQSCSSTPPKALAESYELEVEANSRDSFRSKSFFIDLDAGKPTLVERHCAVLFAQALSIAGYRAAMLAESAELRLEISFNRENPITGTPILGGLTPYRHEAIVKAFGPNSLEWETRLVGFTKSPSKAELCPFFAAAGVDFFGLSSNGVRKILLHRDDSKVQRLLNADKKQGLLE